MHLASQETGSARRTNWSGNYVYTAPQLFEPATVADVQELVRRLPRVRALGTRHCFNGIADSDVAQISTAKLTDVQLDPAQGTVRVGAGTRYGELAVALHQAGFALHNMASLPHISVAGAVATATHGSGLRNGNLATAVVALEFVAADGTLHTLSRAVDPERFPGAVVHLGALGIVTHLTLAVQPSFQMVQAVYENLPFARLEHDLAEVLGAGYSVSLFTDWQTSRVSQVWVKDRVQPGQTSIPSAEFFGAPRATCPLHPLPDQPAEACTDQTDAPGAWFERLPHFRLDFKPSYGEELQSEYFVPLEQGYTAIRALEGLADRIAPRLYISELRAVAPDDLWLSMAYRRPSLAIHFTWKPHWEAVGEILPAIEAALAPFEARPHWGKVSTMSRQRLTKLYPRLNDYLGLVREVDPGAKFWNDYLRGLL